MFHSSLIEQYEIKTIRSSGLERLLNLQCAGQAPGEDGKHRLNLQWNKVCVSVWNMTYTHLIQDACSFTKGNWMMFEELSYPKHLSKI